MIDIYRIDHVRQAVADEEPVRRLLERLFGFRLVQAWEDATEGVRGLRYQIPGTSGAGWELVTPTRGDSTISSFLDSARGPGLCRVGLEVTDLQRALAMLRAEQAHVVDRGPADRWADVELGPAPDMQGLPCRIFAPGAADAARRAARIALPETPRDERPAIGLDGLLHICQAHPDRLAVARWYERATGMREIYRTPDGAWPDMATLMLTVPGSQIIWEVIQPEGGDSHVQRFLDRKGAGFHHATFAVCDWDAAMAACEQHEIPTFGLNEGVTDGGRWCDNFIHPKHTGGVLMQLFWEEHPGVWARSDKIATPR
ncbi:MAG TPA: VOC family protein [Steroidobacter sp.]|nr:VOC family protein [Steroidobacter sp.]